MADDAAYTTLGLFLGRLERLNDALVTDVCRRRGISPSELRVLAVLRHGALGPEVSPTAIGQWVIQTSGGLTATLRRLEAEGRIDRVDDPGDGRSRLVRLTEPGRRFYDELLVDLTDRYRLAFADVDLDDALGSVRSLIDGFERLANVAPTAGGHLLLDVS